MSSVVKKCVSFAAPVLLLANCFALAQNKRANDQAPKEPVKHNAKPAGDITTEDIVNRYWMTGLKDKSNRDLFYKVRTLDSKDIKTYNEIDRAIILLYGLKPADFRAQDLSVKEKVATIGIIWGKDNRLPPEVAGEKLKALFLAVNGTPAKYEVDLVQV